MDSSPTTTKELNDWWKKWFMSTNKDFTYNVIISFFFRYRIQQNWRLLLMLFYI